MNKSSHFGSTMNSDNIAFIDIEGYTTSKEHLYGILLGTMQHKSSSASKIKNLLENNKPTYICGHNFLDHDLIIVGKNNLGLQVKEENIIDTLYLSMLLSPSKRSHKLNKPYKTEIFIENQPAADCVQTKELLLVLTELFYNSPSNLKDSFFNLLFKNKYFQVYFDAIQYESVDSNAHITLLKEFSHLSEDQLSEYAEKYPIEIAILCSTLISKENKSFSQIILHKFPHLPRIREEILFDKQNTDEYIAKFSKEEFGFSGFREFPDVNNALFTVSQRDIVKSAVKGKSLLAVLPTGGGKTFTFQLPSLIKANKTKSLTVVISPLQALMRDQITNFNREIQNYKAAAISSYLSPIGRLNTLEEIRNGSIDILYITPESLRSNTMFTTLSSRIIERFVIDEAHCFSSWGHDFRHDYFYIGQFIKELQESTYQKPIAVSCFTATARPEVLQDIRDYFKKFLNADLESFIASSERTNLSYKAISFPNEFDKYEKLIQIIQESKTKPIIIYRPQNARGCKELVDKLNIDERLFDYDLVIEPFYANIDEDRKNYIDTTRSKSQILEDFISNEVNIVVATTAFGMGIDKPDIQAVIHYDPSDSLEAYMQESGRGARSSDIHAECIVLYMEADFERIFRGLSRSKVEYSEVERIAKVCKAQKRDPFYVTTRRIAEAVGIDAEDTSKDYDQLVKTAALELEKWDVIKRGRNHTRIYATSMPHDQNNKDKMPMEIVHEILDPKEQYYGENYQFMILLMQNIIQRSKDHAIEIEELSDIVGIEKKRIFQIVSALQKEGLLEYQNDISILIGKNIIKDIEKYFHLENEILEHIIDNSKNHSIDLRSLFIGEETLERNKLKKTQKIVNNWKVLARINNYPIKLKMQKFAVSFDFSAETIKQLKQWIRTRQLICRYISDFCLQALIKQENESNEIEICSNLLFEKLLKKGKINLEFYHHSMVYLDELLDSFRLTKGRLIYYNALSFQKGPQILRNTPYYKKEYNESLKIYYEKKIEAVHILRRFLDDLRDKGWNNQKQYMRDYFALPYESFKKQYGLVNSRLKLAITEQALDKINEGLNDEQKEIIKDDTNQAILVLAGPGSGKTKTLVHKIASMVTMENNKPDYFLMLTHSRVAAKEFKVRLRELLGSTAGLVDIYTFHAYAGNIVGKLLTSEDSMDEIIPQATKILKNKEYTLPFKTMLVLDEFQDISILMYEFVQVIFEHMGKEKRIIAVGDDDQCINNFSVNKAEIALMRDFLNDYSYSISDAENDEEKVPVKTYKLLKNYRSRQNLINFTNEYAKCLHNRKKQEDLIPVNNEDGDLILYCYIDSQKGSKTYLTNLAEDAATNPSNDIAILLRTNEEVLTVYSLLQLAGANVQYISERQGFSFGQLVELQDFLHDWKELRSFEEAMMNLELQYKKSSNFELAQKVINEFIDDKDMTQLAEAPITFSESFDEYLKQIKQDEFLGNNTKITVSTMHKSKGREFDTVYLGINPGIDRDEYSKRLLYVAMTRAKNNLHLHTSCQIFEPYIDFFSKNENIQDSFENPRIISFSMNLSDLWLGNTKIIDNIEATKPIAGESVQIVKKIYSNGTGFSICKNGKEIVTLSKATNDKKLSSKILKYEGLGYNLMDNCIVEEIVYWSDPNDEKHIKYKEVLCRIQMNSEEDILVEELVADSENSKINSSYFKGDKFNKLSDKAIERLKDRVDNLGVLKNESLSDYVLEARKEHPRAYEAWSNEEKNLLRTALEYTNDLKLLAECFQRNKGALKSTGDKIVNIKNLS